MIKSMYKKSTGFTIIELLIVIAVIAILATIVTIGWNGVSVQSRNTARANELETWKSTFELYKSRFGSYPTVATSGMYCLGSGFPNGKCGDINTGVPETNSAPLINELKRVSPILPKVSSSSVENKIGPYAWFDDATAVNAGILVMSMFESKTGDCPEGLARVGPAPTTGVLTTCSFKLNY